MTVREIVIIVIAAGLLFFVLRCREAKPTEIEQRVDSTLATVPAWQDTVRARDSAIAVKDRQRNRERELRLAERARADSAEAFARSLQIVADTLALIPEGTASDSVAHLLPALASQKKAAAAFELLVDSLIRHRTKDSLRLIDATETIADMKIWRGQDQRRIDALTVQLSDLREETKRRSEGWVFSFLPSWTDEALLIVGAGYAGYRVGRAAS